MKQVFTTVNRKLLVVFFVVASVSILAVSLTAYQSGKFLLRRAIGNAYADVAAATMDKIDRSLFERYGDVQAFAVNKAVKEYLVHGTDKQELQEFANTMLTTYGIYDLMLVVNLEGSVVLATTVDKTGKASAATTLLGHSVAQYKWFKACASGSIPQGQSFYEDPHFSHLYQELFGERRYIMHYAAPVRDDSGNVIGVWCNYASYDRIVKEIVTETTNSIQKQGIYSFGVTIVDSKGLVLESPLPSAVQTKNFSTTSEAVQQGIAGGKGFVIAQGLYAAQDKEIHAYAHSTGALGYKANKWTLIVHADTNEALAEVATLRTAFVAVSVVVLILVGFVARLISRSITRPVKQLHHAAEQVTQGNYAGLELSGIQTGDELQHLAESFTVMAGSIQYAMRQLADEKASVERKVEQAVADLKEEKMYLQECVNKILHKMEDFANGDFTVRIYSERQDDIARLYSGFNNAVEIVRGIILDIRQTAESNVQVSEQINQLAADVRERIVQQTERMHEIAVAVEEMNLTIRENARNAVITAQAAEKNGTIAKEGASVVSVTATTMRSIADIINASAATVENLGEVSGQIGDILSVINEIADQTNLLALNAAIEAARAGEQGRGFAIVADEVRKLAERTSQAVKEISSMVFSIQRETKGAVVSIQSGSHAIQEGLDHAERASHAIEQILHSTSEVQEMISMIAAASNEQSAASDVIAKNVEFVSAMSKQSAQQINETTGAVDNLHQLTTGIERQIAQFIMDEHDRAQKHRQLQAQNNG
jgi:methyl-accepting chemotaxis protein